MDSFLRKVGLFSNLDPRQLTELEGICHEVSLKPSEVLFREGDEPEFFYVIVKGRIRISRIIPGMGEEALAILETGSYFGEMEIFEPMPRAAQALAHSACVLQAIRISDLHAAMNADRELTVGLLWNFVLTLSERLRNTNDKVMATFALSKFAGN
jgi:CRP/FNR family cyclic AMP-dependent transcriptional regulator